VVLADVELVSTDAASGQKVALDGIADQAPAAGCANALSNVDTNSQICVGVPSTPVLRWNPEPRAAGYLVYLAIDQELTNRVVSPYAVTTNTMWRPPTDLPDNTAQDSYYWFVRPCKSMNPVVCNPDPISTNAAATNAFRKQSPAAQLIAPADASSVTSEPAFSWTDYYDTNQGTPYQGGSDPSYQTARTYRIQISQSATFNSLVDDREVDQPFYTPQRPDPAAGAPLLARPGGRPRRQPPHVEPGSQLQQRPGPGEPRGRGWTDTPVLVRRPLLRRLFLGDAEGTSWRDVPAEQRPVLHLGGRSVGGGLPPRRPRRQRLPVLLGDHRCDRPGPSLFNDGSYQWRGTALDPSGGAIAVSSWRSFKVDGTAPTVVTYSPSSFGTPASKVKVTFSQKVKALTTTSFTLHVAGHTSRLPATLKLASNHRDATLIPKRHLAKGKTYTVKLTKAIHDGAGNHMVTFTWSFSV